MSKPLITKKNYLEIGQVECNECKALLDWNTVDDAIGKYGLIALHKESTGSGYFGYTCPHCIKTSLHETNKGFLQFLLSGHLTNQNESSPHPKGAHILGYNSWFKTGNFHKFETVFNTKILHNEHAMTYSYENSAYFFFINRVEPLLIESKEKLSRYYCTALPRTIAIGPSPTIQYLINDKDGCSYFGRTGMIHTDLLLRMHNKKIIDALIENDDNKLIEEIVSLENEFNQKMVNRYILIDPIYSLINEFNMKYGPYSNTLLWAAENNIYVNKHQSNRQESTYAERKYKEYKITKEIFSRDPQFRTLKIVDFLNVICTPNIDYYIKIKQAVRNSRTGYRGVCYPSLFVEDDFVELKKIYKEIWTVVNNSYLQDILEPMTENFLDEYKNIINRNNCSFDDVWGLRQSYLYNIHKAINSRQKMKIEKQKVAEKYLSNFKVLESPYPSLKRIKTCNYEMIQIKKILITLSKSNRIDRFLLLGETGTGKELFAKAIHELCGRAGAFIPINCASIPENMFEGEFFGHVKGAFTGATSDKSGFFEQADSGTIFLDEIGELDPKFQARFLRVLQEKEFTPIGGKLKKVDFILISATNRDLEKMVEDGTFREDLYQRISDYTIPIPPLSERKEDISLLTHHFIEKYDMALRDNESFEPLIIENDVLNKLEEHTWRGNIRELEKVCKLVLAFRNQDDRSDIKETEFNLTTAQDPQASKSQRLSKRQKPLKKKKAGPGNTKVTSDEVKQALKNNNGNKTKAAEELGVTYHTILRHCKKLGI